MGESGLSAEKYDGRLAAHLRHSDRKGESCRESTAFRVRLAYTPEYFDPGKEIKMKTIDQKGPVTRRAFFQRSAGVFAGAGLLTTAKSAKAKNVLELEAVNAGSGATSGKIALEEHFVILKL